MIPILYANGFPSSFALFVLFYIFSFSLSLCFPVPFSPKAAPEVTIIDEQGTPLLDKYYEVDSTIRLMCIVRHVSMLSSVVYWSHGDTILNFDVSRGGIR
jgi:hypothetical protein